jgi:hypothetical protein
LLNEIQRPECQMNDTLTVTRADIYNFANVSTKHILKTHKSAIQMCKKYEYGPKTLKVIDKCITVE